MVHKRPVQIYVVQVELEALPSNQECFDLALPVTSLYTTYGMTFCNVMGTSMAVRVPSMSYARASLYDLTLLDALQGVLSCLSFCELVSSIYD